MAIFDSAIFQNMSGSVGNVTTYKLGDKQVARSKPFGLSLIHIFAAKQKKKEDRQKTEIKTPYQKFFEGKKKVTREGWMKVHRINGKVYVEFPSAYLGKDMLFASSIENISDNGEGVVGQFAGAGIIFRFTRQDSVIQANMIRNLPFDTGDNRDLTDLLHKSNCGGVYTSFKIEAINPTDSSYLIDMTPDVYKRQV